MNLDKIIDATNNAPRVISEQNDASQIDISTEQDSWDESTVTRTRITSGWDAGEYGVSYEQAKKLSETEEGREELRRRAQQRADLDTSTGKVAMFSAREVPWHGLGKVIDQAVTGDEAIRFAGLADWNLAKIQNFVPDGDGFIRSPGSYSIVRRDTGKVLWGRAGSQYTPFHNEELADFAEGVLGAGAKFETGGSLGGGERVWLLARMPETAIVAEGDELVSYVLFSNSHDGSSAILACGTDERTVCANTYRTAIAGGTNAIRIRHSSRAKTKVREAQRALNLAATQHEEFVTLAQALVAAEMPSAVRQSYFDLVLDETVDRKVAGVQVTHRTLREKSVESAIDQIVDQTERDAAAKQLERVQRRRTAILKDIEERYESDRCNGLPSIAGSAWAAVNAVTESIDHSPIWQLNNPDSSRDPIARREGRMRSLTEGVGARMTEQAVGLATDLVGLS